MTQRSSQSRLQFVTDYRVVHRSRVGMRGPKMPTWSVVWLASVPRSRSGRSAVTATSGTPAWAASSMAGCRLATAVPDVQITAAARADLGQPEGQEPGRALVEPGVQPEQPGLGGVVRRERQRRVARARRQHDLADPALDEAADHRAGQLGGRRHGRPPFRTARTAASRSSHHATRSGGAAHGVERARVRRRAGRPAASRRPARSSGAATSAVSSDRVASPHAWSARAARPPARPRPPSRARSPGPTRPPPASRCPRRSAGRPAPRPAAGP